MDTRVRHGRAAVALFGVFAVLIGAASSLLGTCGPFTDTAADAFCPFVLELFTLGITTGTTASTFDPSAGVSRLAMAAFLSRSVDASLKRSSRRTVLGHFWSQTEIETPIGGTPAGVAADGADIWVSDSTGGTVSRVKASDGRLLETWTGATQAGALISVGGFVIAVGSTNPGRLYEIDATLPAGAVTVVATNLGSTPRGGTLDGFHGWTANDGSVSIIQPAKTVPWTVTTVTVGFNSMYGPVFDGNNIWVSNSTVGTLLKLDSAGAILQTVTVGAGPRSPMYDGTNIWVPNFGNSTVSLVRPSNGVVLATLTGNGLSQPTAAAFDGERVLVTSFDTNNVSLFKAANLAPLGFINVDGPAAIAACSDGINFWIPIFSTGKLQRF